jgi:hypothetical protein
MLAAAARTVARLRSPRPALVVGIAGALAIAFGSARLPVSFISLVVDCVVGLMCLVVFVAMVLALAGGAASPPARRIGRPVISRLVMGMK